MNSIIRFSAIFFTGLCLVPAGAHLLEMPAKMKLGPADYMTMQNVYYGWALLGVLVGLAIIFDIWLASIISRPGSAFTFTLVGVISIVATQVVFWIWTYPMNGLTENWTRMPPDLERARAQWEYSHAASAVLTLVAFTCIVLASVIERSEGGA
jgi:hypothetical protein